MTLSMLARSVVRRSPVAPAEPVTLVTSNGHTVWQNGAATPRQLSILPDGSDNQVLLVMMQDDSSTAVNNQPYIGSPVNSLTLLAGNSSSHMQMFGYLLGSASALQTMYFSGGYGMCVHASIWRGVTQSSVAAAFDNVVQQNGNSTFSPSVLVTVPSAENHVVVGHAKVGAGQAGAIAGTGTLLYLNNNWSTEVPFSTDGAEAAYVPGASPSAEMRFKTITSGGWTMQACDLVSASAGVGGGPDGEDSTAEQGQLYITEAPGAASFSGFVTGSGAGALLASPQAYTDQDRGLFLTFNMSTFVGTEFHDATAVPANTFAPTGMDPAQWADVAADFNCRYAVLTIKHQDGFTLWPTTSTTRGLANTTWYASNGNYDITQHYVDEFRARGLLPIFYFSIKDTYWLATHPTWTNATYKPFVEGQITEVLTTYAPIAAIWLDSTYTHMGNSWAPWTTAEERNAFIRSVSPGIIIIDLNYQYDFASSDVIEYESAVGPPGDNTDPAEHCFSITGPDAWFWKSDDHAMFDVGSIGHFIQFGNSVNCTELVGVPPNTAGVIPQSVIDQLDRTRMYMGETARETPNNMTSNTVPSPYVASAASEYITTGNPAASFPAFKSFNSSIDSFWGSSGASLPTWIQIDLGTAHLVTQYMLQTRKGIVANQWTAWTLAGSADGSAWTTVDTRTQPTIQPGEVRFYSLSASQTYRYWRWTITGSATGTDADMGNIALFAGVTAIVTDKVGTLAATGAADIANFTAPASAFETETLNWEAAVGSINVSGGRKTLINNLIAGLKTDGVWVLLDRLWIYAAENQTCALTDLKGLDVATVVGAISFVADDGYFPNGSSTYINTTFNPMTDGVQYTQPSACGGIWNVTTSAANAGAVAIGGVASTVYSVSIFMRYTDNNTYARINSTTGAQMGAAYTGPGLFMLNRSDAFTANLYRNGSSIASSGGGSAALTSANVFVGAENSAGTATLHAVDQIAACIFGASLTGAQHTSLYNRLRTYMTAVGVP